MWKTPGTRTERVCRPPLTELGNLSDPHQMVSVERIFCECDAPLVGRSICDRTDRVASGSRIDRGEPAKRADEGGTGVDAARFAARESDDLRAIGADIAECRAPEHDRSVPLAE
jgi:hypothetical protein